MSMNGELTTCLLEKRREENDIRTFFSNTYEEKTDEALAIYMVRIIEVTHFECTGLSRMFVHCDI